MPRIEGTKSGVDAAGQPIYSPVLIVQVTLPGFGHASVPAVIDSGADVTIVPFEVFVGAGLEWTKLPAGSQGLGAGGVFERRPLQAEIRYRDWLICDSVEVAQPGALPFALLGRQDFFQKFIVRFAWHKSPPEVIIDPVVLTAKRKR